MARNKVDLPPVNLPPVIAIHGVGHHELGKIKKRLGDAFNRASISADIEEFNWDSFVEHSAERVQDAVQLLNMTASSISQAAALVYRPSDQWVDRFLFTLEEFLYHGFLRFFVAAGLTIVLVGPLLHLLVLLPSSMFTGLMSWQLDWVKTAVFVGCYSGLCVILGLFILAILRSVINSSTRPLWVIIRRVTLLLVQPIFLLLTVPLSIRFGSGVAKHLGSIISMVLMSSILSIVLSPLYGNFAEILSGIGWSLLFLLGIAVVAGLHILLRQLWVGVLLKVLLDITRYMGSPEYRAKLLEEFDRKISQIRFRGEGHRFVLYAHSLGSVIALDSIVNSEIWQPYDEVQLVTFGSPIARFFIRFFPGYLFPPSIRDASNVAARRLGRFSWINIYRRWDYVGTRLGLETAKVGLEVCTGQRSKIASAHLGYWEDERVLHFFKNSLTQVVPVLTDKTTAYEVDYSLPAAHTDTSQYRVARMVRKSAILVVLLVIGIAGFNFIQSRGAWMQSIDQEIVEIQRQGERGIAAVTYYRTIEGSGEDRSYLHHFMFELPEPYGELPSFEIPDGLVYGDYVYPFDYNALADFVLEDCTRAEKKKWWQIFKSSKSIPCTRTEIPIWFKADNPESFWLPGFPTVRTFGDIASELLAMLILTFYFIMGCFVIVMFGGIPLFRLFLGLEALEQAKDQNG